MKLAVSITTYQRKDGKTPFYLKRALDSVDAQSHEDFQVFIVGDHYEDAKEFYGMLNKYSTGTPMDMFYANLKMSVERERYADDKVCYWNSAGINASNHASNMAMMAGFDYICHLDHDDWWAPNHLSVVSDALDQTQAAFVCTKSTWGESFLPQHDLTDRLIPWLPFHAGCINSSTCYNHRKVPLRYRDSCEARGFPYPSDADLWDRITLYIKWKGLTSYFINELTCFHDEEGYLLK